MRNKNRWVTYGKTNGFCALGDCGGGIAALSKKRHRIVFAFCDIGLQEICCVIALFAVHYTYFPMLTCLLVYVEVNVWYGTYVKYFLFRFY